jgi:CheY-like chemotaxis protein
VTHKLLLADDSVTIQRVVELTFSGEDVQVVTVGDGEQAITRIPIELPDIVLADIGMPKRSGYDVAAFVKGRADLSHIPVLLLAGAFEPVDENRARQVRSDGVLVKPFEPQQVISRVRDLIESSRSASARPQPVAAAAAFADQHTRTADVVAHTPRPAAVPEPKATVIEARERSTESKLDDYFDRLDAAFAELGSDADRDRRSRPEVRDEYDGHDVPTLESLLAVSSGAGPEELPPPEPPVPVELAEYEPPVPHAPLRAQNREAAQPMEGRNLVADMFQALFAAEQGEAVAPAPYQAPRQAASPATVTDSLVDEVTRRVVERLAPDTGNELVAQIVSEVAERLIREEISRIKAAAAARL